MHTKDFNFGLPNERIAQYSVEPRDQSKLMVVHKDDKRIENKTFTDIVDYVNARDIIIWNNSKVFKARLKAKLLSKNDDDLWEHKRDIELFLVRPMENVGVWKVLAKPGKHVLNGMRIEIAKDFICNVVVKEPSGTILVQFEDDAETVMDKANIYGSIPIPPYVKDEPHQLSMYQNIYAEKEGSVAAPTAGFHFTDRVIKALKQKGVEFAEVTLHVGLGTFLPVKSEKIEDHTMHAEWVEISQETVDKIQDAKDRGGRVIAVGTTSTRTLEGVAEMVSKEPIKEERVPLRAYEGDVNIFITPGFEFKVVDVMVTNFHLPKSTLLMLVSAFAGDRKFMLDCYKQAVDEKYRFYSFGDSMMIL